MSTLAEPAKKVKKLQAFQFAGAATTSHAHEFSWLKRSEQNFLYLSARPHEAGCPDSTACCCQGYHTQGEGTDHTQGDSACRTPAQGEIFAAATTCCGQGCSKVHGGL